MESNSLCFHQSGTTIRDMEQTPEIWKPIPGFKGIEASSHGRIRDAVKVRKLSLTGKYYKVGRGYLACRIEGKLVKAHRLVALAFLEPVPNKPLVNHRDGNTSNNRPENLEWTDTAENTQHSFANGHQVALRGEAKGTAKLTAAIVAEMRASGFGKEKASKVFGISRTQAGRILKGESWK